MNATVELLYFAWVRERTGTSAETFSLPAGVATVGALIDALRARGPGFASAFAAGNPVRAAVNQVLARPEAAVAPGDEIAFFPPITGG